MEKSKIYPIKKEYNSLSFIKSLTHSFQLYLTDNLEIEPFTKWTTEFASEYWYLKYHLLLDGEININNNNYDLEFLFNEINLNIIWLTITDKKNFELKCKDGVWQVEILNNEFNQLYVFLDL